MDKPIAAILTVSAILFGFLFAGFWWTLNREVGFEDKTQRHFKLGTGMLLASMGVLGVCGIVLPLREIAGSDPRLLLSYRGIVIALVGVFGYMLVELGHYSVFQVPKYITRSERILFIVTIAIALALGLGWVFLK